MKLTTFLIERSMSAKSLTSAIASSPAKVGFEFEVVVPVHSPYFEGNDDIDPPDTISLDSDDYYIVVEYFKLSRSEFRELEREYDSWVDDRRQEFIKQAWDDYEGDLSVHDFSSEKEEEFEQPDETTWINDAYGSVYELVRLKHLDPKFGFTDRTNHEVFKTENNLDQRHAFDATAREVGAHLGDELGIQFKYENTTATDWKIVEDTSITPESSMGVGIEIVTAPLVAKDAVEAMHTCFSFFKRAKFETNGSTGVHVNVSVPNLDKLDPLKLVLFMGEEFALRQFNRLFSNVAAPHINRLIKAIGTGAGARDVSAVMDEARMILKKSGKYSSVNIDKLSQGYLEFRVAGGYDYHHEEDLLLEQLGRWLEALKIATDPDLYRNEYLKKVVKLIEKAGVPIEDQLALKAMAKSKKT